MSGIEASGGARTGKIVRALDFMIEYGIYLYVFALFNQGTTALSNLGLYVPFAAWLGKHGLNGFRGLDYLRQPVAAAMIIFALAVFPSTLYAPDPAYSLDSYRKTIGTALALALVIGEVFRDEARLKRLVWGAAFSGMYVTGLDLLQYAREYLGQGDIPSDLPAHRWYGDPALFLGPFTLAAAYASSGWASRLWFTAFAIEVALLVPTGARGSWLGFGVGMAVWMTLRLDRRLLIAAAIGLAGAGVAAVTVLPSSVVLDRVKLGYHTARTSATWGPTYEMIVDKPWLGYGYGRKVYHDEFNRRAPNSPWWYMQKSVGPHCNYLEIFFAAGVVAFAAVVFLFARLWGYLFAFLKRAPPGIHPLAGLATLAAFTGFFLVRGFVESSRWQPLGVLVGIAIAVLVAGRTAEVARSEK